MKLVAKKFCCDRDFVGWNNWLDVSARKNLDPIPRGPVLDAGCRDTAPLTPLGIWLADTDNRQVFTVLDTEDGNRQVGGFILRSGGDDAGPGVAYVEAVVVAPGLRGSGVGAAMVPLVKSMARLLGYCGLCASVFVDNPAAVRLLELAGLREGRWFAGGL